MTAETARAIISQALEDEMFEGEMPEDDSAAIEAAEGLVAMAKDAWEQNVQTPEVAALLKLAEANGDGPSAKPKPKPAAAKPKPGRPKPQKKEPEPEPADPRSQEEPWEGYDSDSVTDIIEGVEVWGDEGDTDSVTHVLLYEAAHKNRKKIVDRASELTGRGVDPEPEPDPEPEAEAEPEEVDAEPAEEQPDAQEEPFEGFAALKVSEVKESLDEYLENEDVSDEDKLWTLKHVFAYESIHKNRTGLLDRLDELMKPYTEDGSGEEDAAAEAEGAGEAEDAAAPSADAGGEDGDSEGEGDGEAARPAAAKRTRRSGGASDGAAADAVRLYAVTTEGGVVQSLGKFAVAGLVLDLLSSGVTSIQVDAE